MINRKLCLPLIGAFAVAASAAAAQSPSDVRDDAVQGGFNAPTGQYVADQTHRYITFSYSHLGFSNPYVRWRDWDATLDWNAEDPEKSSVSVTIDAASVDTGVDVFDGHMKGDTFFDVANHPEITFVSTEIKRTDDFTGTITGDLTIKGNTLPVTLETTFNKGDFVQRSNLHKLGFSAKTTVKRSDFGVDAFAPAVSDEVEIVIEVEFDKPIQE